MKIIRDLLTKFSFAVEGDKLAKLEGQLDGIKHRLGFLVGAELLHGLVQLAERFGSVGERIEIGAYNAGLAVEEFQKLTGAAAKDRVGFEEMEGALARLARKLNDAREGGAEAIKSFADAGLQMGQVRGFKNAGEAMVALSARFQAIQDPIKKAALAQELLGRNSAKMVSFLSKGPDAIRKTGDELERLGMILRHDQIEALAKAESSLNKFWNLMRAIGATIAAYVAPVISLVVDEFFELYKANKELVDVNLVNWLSKVAFAFGALWEVIKFVVGGFIQIAQKLGIDKHLLLITTTVIGLIVALAALGTILGFIGTAIAAIGVALEAFAIVASIAAIVVSIHDLYAAFNGKKGWVEQFWEWARSLSVVKNALDSIKGFFGADQKLAALSSPPASFLGSGAGAGISSPQNYSINAPVTVNVPAGTDPAEIGKFIESGLKDHLDGVYRETRRSVQTPVAY